MRIDQLLNKLCLVKTRTIAKNACDKNLIQVNGKKSKASQNINEGDEISIALGQYKTVVKITQLPKGNVAKKDAGEYYEVLKRTKIQIDE